MSCAVILKEKGFKLTPQRRLIVDLIHQANVHITAEEIVSNVQTRMPGVNKSTIYRTLELLEETGCVYKSTLNHQFIYHHAAEGHHHHLQCSKCGRIISCSENIFLPVEKVLRDKYGFRVDFRHVVLKGICDQCKK
ncbi:MAG: Fur family transcriptional regulator [Chloroflexi bacterium]|nr:Fur family transcriptional regulator [Chloroflexota bacterium]